MCNYPTLPSSIALTDLDIDKHSALTVDHKPVDKVSAPSSWTWTSLGSRKFTRTTAGCLLKAGMQMHKVPELSVEARHSNSSLS
mmetsp:Transcript_42138/g.67235  ORF Transcript_42138/g.67235 Transcript_42138/m.67235 type:complete len:84 (+) Transcript_42138:118-369(+)